MYYVMCAVCTVASTTVLYWVEIVVSIIFIASLSSTFFFFVYSCLVCQLCIQLIGDVLCFDDVDDNLMRFDDYLLYKKKKQEERNKEKSERLLTN